MRNISFLKKLFINILFFNSLKAMFIFVKRAFRKILIYAAT